ncbi:hypothetical protein ACJ6WD_11165 [Streptomyces sp. VTCC 41912]|uniref:deazapurine DNA modification protein DpdA family protein n=1 Tax=Streptomyces sp. VTCC 41912 TaxID=3383243 RepID=UPI003896AD43
MTFFLGTHIPSWLGIADVPLFVSHRRLIGRKTFPRAVSAWALDSGGFTEISMHGQWTISVATYIAAVRRYSEEIGNLQWASPQDWMCEPQITQKTGLTVTEHQHRTVSNYLDLRAAAPDLPFIPVLQGWDRADYQRCADLYEKAGVDLAAERVVGIGSVCRRQHMDSAVDIITDATDRGMRIHGFGFKITGLRRVGHLLTSSDSMSWSLHARYRPPLLGCTHKTCSNCRRYALRWRQRPLAAIDEARANNPRHWEQAA